MSSIDQPHVLIPVKGVIDVHGWDAAWGWIDFKANEPEELFVVTAFSDADRIRLGYDLVAGGHFTKPSTSLSKRGVWYRASPRLHDYHQPLSRQQASISTADFKDMIGQGWRSPPADRPMLVLAFTNTPIPQVTAWWVTPGMAWPAIFQIVPYDLDPLQHLATSWPIDELKKATATVVGVGSIGSSAVESLASAGIGKLNLVDYDRLAHHNLPRHRLTAHDIGRLKVVALREQLQPRFPTTDFVALGYNVEAHADLLRPIIADSHIVVCAADGVEARRVTNHLARRATTPAVFVAVLENGAYGEIVRVRPNAGCLGCLRRTLEEQGQFDPEPGLDLGYGTGTAHRPMTAAPTDLRLMAELASKAAIATVLHRMGHPGQQLADDWAVVGLQPESDAPKPFNDLDTGSVRWSSMPPKRPDCPTCSTP